MEIPESFDKGHHLFTDNLFKTYATAAYLLKRLFSNWGYVLHHLPNVIITAKPENRIKLTEIVAEQTCYNVVNKLWCF